MPYPGTTGTPYFKGANITSFLDRYEDLCSECGLRTDEMINRLPRYCEMMIEQTVEIIKE